MSKNFRRNNRGNNFGNMNFFSKIKEEVTKRFEKAEIAGLGVLLFIFILFPLSIFLAGFIAFGVYKYWRMRNSSKTRRARR